MLNQEINSRFNDWLLNPTEGLDFEVKGWLDPNTNVEDRGSIVKAIIALENHGGGFLLIGYTENSEKQLIPDQNRPDNLEAFSTDAINGYLRNYAEPVFHVDVSIQTHSETGETFPLIRVHGTSDVPVRSAKDTPGRKLINNTYYIRRPGPASQSPIYGYEWDQLIERCVLKQRSKIIDTLKSFSFLTSENRESEKPTNQDDLKKFTDESFAKWRTLNEALPADNEAKIIHGTFCFSCQINGVSRNLSPPNILNVIEGLRRYTGWPILVVLHQTKTKPYIADGVLEASLIELQSPNSARADFWRVSPKGFIYLLRGYQEDALEMLTQTTNQRKPGTGIDFTLPVWRVAEFLLRIEELARSMYEPGFSLSVTCEWNSLQNRELFAFNSHRLLFGGRICKADHVSTCGTFTQDEVIEFLPDVVKSLTAELYEHFDFFTPPSDFYEQEISRLRTGAI